MTPMEQDFPVICKWVRHSAVSIDALRAELQKALDLLAPETAEE